MRNRAGPKFENSYQTLTVPREQQQHSYPSDDHAAKAAGKNLPIFTLDRKKAKSWVARPGVEEGGGKRSEDNSLPTATRQERALSALSVSAEAEKQPSKVLFDAIFVQN